MSGSWNSPTVADLLRKRFPVRHPNAPQLPCRSHITRLRNRLLLRFFDRNTGWCIPTAKCPLPSLNARLSGLWPLSSYFQTAENGTNLDNGCGKKCAILHRLPVQIPTQLIKIVGPSYKIHPRFRLIALAASCGITLARLDLDHPEQPDFGRRLT